MARRTRILLALVALSPLLLAMGGRGGGPTSDTIPRPHEKYSAELVDKQGMVTRVSQFSCNGRTFFPLDRGEGTLMIPFAKVTRVTVGAEKGNSVEASLQVEGGTTVDGRLPRTLLCTGATDFGSYQIEFKGLKEIKFLAP